MFDYYKNKHEVVSSDMIKPGLEAVNRALRMLNNPHLAQFVCHVAGTNGKGSTITMLERICQEHQLTTATFMSPCIEDVHDQIKINGHPITTEQMDLAFLEVKKAGISGLLTDFELLTVIAFTIIREANVDLAIIESGMGGRFDSTNSVEPLVSIIPSIALEHTNYLGNTLASIAFHKAGIIKQNSVALIGTVPEEAHKVIVVEAAKKQAQLLEMTKDFHVNGEGYFEDGQLCYTQLKRSMLGAHQGANMALAIRAFHAMATTLQIQPEEQKIRHAVATSFLAGRFEKIARHVYMDGAHNPASAKKLRQTIEEQFPQAKICFIVGMLKDKDVNGVLRELEQVSEQFVFVAIEQQQTRQMPIEQLLKISQARQKSTAQNVVEVVNRMRDDCIVIVTGSLYLLATWRKSLLEQLK